MGARTFVVVGGTSGLGLAVARLLVDEHQVVVFGNVPAEVAAATDELGCDGAVCDISSYEQVRDGLRRGGASATARSTGWRPAPRCGRAASWRTCRWSTSAGPWRSTFWASRTCCGRRWEHLHRQGHGNVVYIGALALAAPRPGIPVYRATKSYGNSLVDSLAEAQHSNRVKVMQLHPGPMPTRLQERVGAEFLDEVYAMPGQVATEVVRLLLLEPDDLYVSGERVLRADGRW